MAALNDPSRSRIGDPSRGTFYISIPVDELFEADVLGRALTELGIAYQANLARDAEGRAARAYLMIYGRHDQQRLLDRLEPDLDPARRRSLARLVRARSPLPAQIVERIGQMRAGGKTWPQISLWLRESNVTEGVGARGWTPAKARRKYGEALALLEDTAAA